MAVPVNLNAQIYFIKETEAMEIKQNSTKVQKD